MRFSKWLEEAEQQLAPDTRFQSYGARVAQGKGVEDQIYQHLSQNGMRLFKPKPEEDMHSKIDAWWSQPDGAAKGIQIKYRDTGDDVLFEVWKDYKNRIPGRDMVSKAEYYAVKDRAGQIRLFKTAEAKMIVNMMMKRVEQVGWSERNDFKMVVPGGFGYLMLRQDPASGVEKVVAYIPTGALKLVPYGAGAA
jgi:hypothetical protein